MTEIISLPHRIDADPQIQQNFEETQTHLKNLKDNVSTIENSIATINTKITATAILNALKTVDGSGSGLDADKLDGYEASYFLPASYHDKVGCRVFLSADQTIADATTTTLQFDTEAFDYGSGWDTSTYKWTAPKDGVVIINLQVATNVDWDSYGTANVRVWHNGVVVGHSRVQKMQGQLTLTLAISSGDTIYFTTKQNSGSSQTIDSSTPKTFAEIWMVWHE